ncbi:odorant receptor 13a-like isoform X1 [Harpegnathos saltator]|uniref:odorant receptor 13a-like isoform X1 n=1 Tax=Harpegnathos saltator TaxID=610380 RepID=UPI000DBEECEF|nr:odorant receptor 13a-like isoform X1 [Harpegnathos saltator]
MTTKARLAKVCTYSLLVFNSMAGILYFRGENLITVMRLMLGFNVTSRPLPIKLLLPFDAEQSPIYEVLFVALFVHSMSIMYTVNFLSGLVLTLVFHVSGQIDIIHRKFKSFSEKISYYGSSETIGMLVEKHNKVILFSENVDKLFSFIALMQVLGNTLVICFLGLVFTTVSIAASSARWSNSFSLSNRLMKQSSTGADADLLRTIFAYAGITVEIFMFCFLGEYLGLKNKSLGDAAYESLWYNMSPGHGRNILFVIMRSQKHLTITLGGITNLSLEAFTSIMKASASYMSVLNAMY